MQQSLELAEIKSISTEGSVDAAEGQSGTLARKTEPGVAMWPFSLPALLHTAHPGLVSSQLTKWV